MALELNWAGRSIVQQDRTNVKLIELFAVELQLGEYAIPLPRKLNKTSKYALGHIVRHIWFLRVCVIALALRLGLLIFYDIEQGFVCVFTPCVSFVGISRLTVVVLKFHNANSSNGAKFGV